MIERVAVAINAVCVVAHSGPETDHALRWAIRDPNHGEEIGIVWVGGEFTIESDNLDRPPHDTFWPLADAKARAAIRAMREPTPAMEWAATGRSQAGNETLYGSVFRAMIDAALAPHAAKPET